MVRKTRFVENYKVLDNETAGEDALFANVLGVGEYEKMGTDIVECSRVPTRKSHYYLEETLHSSGSL